MLRQLLVVCLLVVCAGCLGGTPTSDVNDTETSIQQDTATTVASVENPKDRARDAEGQRVRAVLQNASNISGTVPGYDNPTVAVVNRTAQGVTVEVTMTYSYEYSCGSKGGNADNLRTRTIYLVTESETRVETVHQDVNLLCD